MAIWDFVKDAGKSIFGSEAKAAEAPTAAETEQSETDRKVAALKQELTELGLTSKDVHLTLRGGDTVVISGQARDQETMEKLILAVGNIKGIAHVELAEDPGKSAGFGAAHAAPPPSAPPGGAEMTPTQTTPEPAAVPASAPAEFREPVFHTVQKGETLSAIAQEYLGKASRYPEIFEANKPMLSDPDKIYPGQMLRIPQE
ncbi:LysM and BON domain-containing protein [Paracoccus sp. MBLB3053]|uniref:LysM and BON domain-containing protein n=1 Tax=Paracoccus aurantius TaxID=3073814 RepID=A0ABU2HMI9_9RHOB|nr:LysM and BON domain-containing protein [Paracoccus sp. MBLB3053]MDS9466252.1 LysM and BON domain-containing protein [Paracoccus sp. MBLB3053]